jgi:hypothetical protein
MVDLDALINLLKELGLGVTPKTVFEINRQFFQEFMPVSSES